MKYPNLELIEKTFKEKVKEKYPSAFDANNQWCKCTADIFMQTWCNEVGIERWHRLMDSIEKKQRIELLKKIRNRYGFPVWLINEALKYYNNDKDKAVERLIKIYNAIGDNPNVVIKRNIEKFKKEIGI